MNRLKAFFCIEKDWYKEVYQIYYREALTEYEKDVLSDYRNKREIQKALENLGVNLYQTSKITNKDAVLIITKGCD